MRASFLGSLLPALLIVACAASSTPGPHAADALAPSAAGGDALTGAWRVATVRYLWVDGEATIDPALPGLFLFTGDHYSFAWHQGDERQADYAKPWSPTDAEKVLSYNAIVVNAGRFRLAGDTLITRPFVAKTPEFEGGEARFIYKVSGDTLRLAGSSIWNHRGELDPGAERYHLHTLCIRER
jgi:hypothetical protein